jgi:hypothetical protein
MAVGVVSIGRRRYATGLYWQVSPSGRVAVAAKEAARQPGQFADYFAVRAGTKEGRIPQFGLGQNDLGHRPGMPTLAATLANRQPGSWAGAFKIREGVYLVIARDDLITPDGDQLYADETEARNRLYEEIKLGGLQRIYAPEAWSIPGSDGMSLPLLLQDKADCPLQPVVIPRSLIVGGGVAAALLVIVLIAGYFWQQNAAQIERERLLREEAQKRAELAANQQPGSGLVQQQINYPPPIKFWEQEPRPLELIEACRVALAQVSIAHFGWDNGGISCNAGGLNVQMGRRAGFSTYLPNATIDVSGASAVRTVPLEGLNPRGEEVKLSNQSVITQKFLTENWRGVINRATDDPPPPRPPEIPPEQWSPPPTPWVKRSFTVATESLPGELPKFFGDLPGVIIKSLTYNGGNWTAEGVIYENRNDQQ